MTNFFKFLMILAPVTVLILYLAVLHSQEVSTRMNIADKQFNQAVNCFERDWANFNNPKYWKEKQKHPCTTPDCKKEQRQLQEVEKKEYAVATGLANAINSYGKDNKTKTTKLYIPK